MTTSLTHWAGALSSAWGIDATLDALAGEYDLNLRATATDGRRFILKVMRPGCDEGFVDLLCRAHAHIQSRDPSVPVPAVIPTRDGRLHCTVRDADGNA